MDIFLKYEPFAVMHFSGFSQVVESVQDSGKYWQDNVLVCLA